LAESAGLRPISLEAMKIKKCVEADQLKATVEGIRYAIISEENRLAGLLDDTPVRSDCSLAGQIMSGKKKTPQPLATTADVDN
jgi:hypothetical protein